MTVPGETIAEQGRPGGTRACPHCGAEIVFTTLHLHDGPVPFFFSDRANEVLLRRSDEERARRAAEQGANSRTLLELWETIVADAPTPPSGGRYTLWANFRCPTCLQEIPYDGGNRKVDVRINEHTVVLPDGSTVVGDDGDDTWRVRVQPPHAP